jgi:hypothetical protein
MWHGLPVDRGLFSDRETRLTGRVPCNPINISEMGGKRIGDSTGVAAFAAFRT